MYKRENVIALFIVLFCIFPCNSIAQEEIRLGTLIPDNEIRNSIDIFIKTEKCYLSNRFDKNIEIDFHEDAREIIITKYADALIPSDFQRENYYPLFKEVLVTDIGWIAERSYFFSIKRRYRSVLNFYKEAQRDVNIEPILVIPSDVEKSFIFFKCHRIPQPKPPKCPKDCVSRTYERLLSYFLHRE